MLIGFPVEKRSCDRYRSIARQILPSEMEQSSEAEIRSERSHAGEFLECPLLNRIFDRAAPSPILDVFQFIKLKFDSDKIAAVSAFCILDGTRQVCDMSSPAARIPNGQWHQV